MEKISSQTSGLKILCVDDEPNILEAFKRSLRGKFELEIATSAEKALEIIAAGQNFAVIVSDMRMPGVDGIAFLQKVRETHPLTVRIMLTGNADQGTAVKAINEGSIFRFLTKPCSSLDMERILTDSVAQYRLQTAERDLLQNTLSGSIKVLTDILSISDPETFSKASECRPLIRKICSALKIDSAWEIELATMLSGLGWALIPDSLRNKVREGQGLSAAETKMVEEIPETSKGLINNIPRLHGVAELVYYSGKNYDGSGYPSTDIKGESIPLGARVVNLVLGISSHLVAGGDLAAALLRLQVAQGRYDPKLLALLKGFESPSADKPKVGEVYEIKARELCVGQRLMADVFTQDGRLLLGRGVVVSEILLKRLSGYAALQALREPISVDCRLPTVDRE